MHGIRNMPLGPGVYSFMYRCVGLAVLLMVCSIISSAEEAKYLRTIQERWNVSDLVCIGTAASPVRTGITRKIDGSDRDQLSSEVNLETCFKGNKPVYDLIQVIGYSIIAERNLHGGYVYSGAPVGFVRKGRNLFFLCRTGEPRKWDIAVPVYETAIRLADDRPYYPVASSASATRFALTEEFEAALIQFDANDVSDIDRILDLLGAREGIAELTRFSERVPFPVQRDIAVALLSHDQLDHEPLVISLLMDTSSPAWKRSNAAEAIGAHGTERGLSYLRDVAGTPVTTDDLRSLRLHAIDSLERLKRRLSNRPD